MAGTYHITFVLGLNLFLLISFVQSKAVSYCAGEFVEDVDLSQGVCAELYVSNNTKPFKIPAETGSQYSRRDWDIFINNSDEVKCIKVSKQHILRLCHINKLTSFKAMYCRSSNAFQKEIEHWDMSPRSILGFDCGKKLLMASSESNCHETCEKAEDLTDKRQCATLYIGDDCSTCSFNSVPLYYNKEYDRKNSNLSTIMSIKLRENCSVVALHEEDQKKERQYVFQNQLYFSTIHDKMQYGIYEYTKFWCTCTDTTDLMQQSSLTSQESIEGKLPLILLIAIGAILALLVATVALLVVQHFYISRISEKKLYNALVSIRNTSILPSVDIATESVVYSSRTKS